MQSIRGDIVSLALEGCFDVIVHGCNCFCTMEAGVALAIQQEFPEAYAADLITIKGDRNKLGDYSSATVLQEGRRITIINGYTQFHFQGEPPLVDYQAVGRLFARVKKEYGEKHIGYPRIGAGLAGGDWSKIARIIDLKLAGTEHKLVLLPVN